jgi:K+-transporting ATPase ATPase C chain
MLKSFGPALRLFFILTLLTGVVYPLLVLGFAQTFFRDKANGSLMTEGGQSVGSKWIAQKFVEPKYIWPRPSAVDYNALASGGSNLSMVSAQLKKQMQTEQAKFGLEPAPLELLQASASGLDPEISPAAALFQVERVAKARGFSAPKSEEIIALIRSQTENRQIGFLGEPRVNVLELNRMIDGL